MPAQPCSTVVAPVNTYACLCLTIPSLRLQDYHIPSSDEEELDEPANGSVRPPSSSQSSGHDLTAGAAAADVPSTSQDTTGQAAALGPTDPDARGAAINEAYLKSLPAKHRHRETDTSRAQPHWVTARKSAAYAAKLNIRYTTLHYLIEEKKIIPRDIQGITKLNPVYALDRSRAVPSLTVGFQDLLQRQARERASFLKDELLVAKKEAEKEAERFLKAAEVVHESHSDPVYIENMDLFRHNVSSFRKTECKRVARLAKKDLHSSALSQADITSLWCQTQGRAAQDDSASDTEAPRHKEAPRKPRAKRQRYAQDNNNADARAALDNVFRPRSAYKSRVKDSYHSRHFPANQEDTHRSRDGRSHDDHRDTRGHDSHTRGRSDHHRRRNEDAKQVHSAGHHRSRDQPRHRDGRDSRDSRDSRDRRAHSPPRDCAALSHQQQQIYNNIMDSVKSQLSQRK